MYGQYLSSIVRRAFQPGARFTDILQILAASAAPAAAKFLGLRVPSPEDTLAYIGAVAVAFVAMRLFFVAPYQVWREQVGDIARLKLELSKPERIELERMAKMRAKARIKLAGAIREAQLHVFMRETTTGKFRKLQREAARLAALTQLEDNALNALSEIQSILDALHLEIVEKGSVANDHAIGKRVANLCAYLHGNLDDRYLAYGERPVGNVKPPGECAKESR